MVRASAGSVIFTGIISLLWYSAFLAGAVATAVAMANPASQPILKSALPPALFLAFLYWQVFPVIMASNGAAMDIRRLMVYPVPRSQLFGLETLLRISVAVEVMVVTAGAVAGLLCNREAKLTAPLALLVFMIFNLFLSTGIKQVLGRWLERKYVREMLVLGIVLAATLPQAFLVIGPPQWILKLLGPLPAVFSLLPWKLTSQIVLGSGGGKEWLALLAWTIAAYLFGRRQFDRSLDFDIEAARSETRAPEREASAWAERIFGLPTRILPDPLGAMVEMELRFLSRAPRFRLVLLMGCVLGQVLWLPQTMSRHGGESVIASNYLTFCTLYALLILGDCLFFNAFGFDRAATQLFFVTPVHFSQVLLAKNVIAMIFVTFQLCFVTVVCFVLRLPVSPAKIGEAFAVVYTCSIFLMAMGNLGSVYQARAVNPAQSWRNSASAKLQASLMLIYPVLALPILLAYGARYAFESQAAFYGVLLIDVLIGAGVYWVAMDSAVEAAGVKMEKMLTALGQGDGPVVSS